MSKDSKINNFKKLAKVLDIILKISYWALVIALPIFVIVALLMIAGRMILSEDTMISVLEAGQWTTSIGALGFSFNAAALGYENIFKLLTAFSISGILSDIILIFSVKQIIGVIKNVLNETPFSKSTVKHVRNLGYCTIVGGVLFNMLMTLIEYIELTAIDIESILSSSSLISDVTITLTPVDGVTIVIGLLIILLAGILNYGTYLQEEYDATL